MIEKEKIILFIVCLVVYVFHEFIEILLYFVRLFLERITSALREYLWDKGLDFLRHGFALFYMEKQSIWAEAMENGDLEILQNQIKIWNFNISNRFCKIYMKRSSPNIMA